MSREIKFRAWLKDIKQFAEIRHISFFEGERIFKIYDQPMSEEVWFELEDLELLQYTGLKDANDVEIYEGDIVCFTTEIYIDGVYVERNYIEYVNYRNSSFCLDGLLLADISDTDDEIEVVGNIYENPELLEAKKHE
ncbi:YopX family protein [Carnobacterium pleistocenium]|uniref:YopX family protein n=1 Tax=Carnobacterium pleistocenium TaxID=181073 RepID=UPI0005596AD7|nr:YopX family protein [Carnobacterium pleistocenium]